MEHVKALRRLCLGALLLAAAVPLLLTGTGRTKPVFVRMPDQTLIIDPGHGGEDGGAVSVTGRPESGVNLSIARRLDLLMGFCGAPAVMTRETDVSIHDRGASTLREKKVSDLRNRVALVNGVGNGTLITIHQNASPRRTDRGCQVFYGDEVLSRPLARRIQAAVREQLDPGNRREVQRVDSSVYLMNHISCRAVLVECGFLSNPEDDRQLHDPAYQKKLAVILAACYLTDGDTQEGESLL